LRGLAATEARGQRVTAWYEEAAAEGEAARDVSWPLHDIVIHNSVRYILQYRGVNPRLARDGVVRGGGGRGGGSTRCETLSIQLLRIR